MTGSTAGMLVGARDPGPAAGAGTSSADALLPYVPRIVRTWAADPSERHRAIEGSMLFVDLSGFTAMSERLARSGNVGAEEVTDIISTTFTELLRHAYDRGGSLLKFGGDALLIFFDEGDHTPLAAAAAHNMKRALSEIGTIETSAGTVRLSMTSGIHSGMFDFFLAGENPHELLIAGPGASAVVAAEGSARSGEIIVSAATARRLPEETMSVARGGAARLRRAPSVRRVEALSGIMPAGDLSPFVTPAVRMRIDAGDVDPEHRRVTIGFVAFHGTDALVAHDARSAAEELDRLVGDVQRAAESRGAAYLGSDIAADGGKLILAAGAPTATGHDEETMLLALRDIVSGSRRIEVRAGATSGTAFFGDVGPPFRRTLTVMGDSVNVAARLMAAARAGSVVTTRATLDESAVCFDVARLDPLHLKGKRRAVDAVEVGRPSGKADHVDRSVPLIGRRAEVATIRSAIQALAHGSGGAFEIRADPGMGKSMLLTEAFDGLEGTALLRVECDLYEASTPYRTAQKLLSAFTGIDPDTPGAADELRELVTAAAPGIVPLLPLIGTAFRIEIPDTEDVAAIRPEFRNEMLHETVGTLISAIATGPAVAVVDDAHWADAASRDLLASLAGLAADRPWLLAFAGNTWTFDDPSVVRERIELPPLAHDDAVELVNALTADRPIAPHETEAIAARSAGVPSFLHALVDAVRDGGDVDALPSGIEGLIAARLDRLPPGARRLVRAAAVLGPSFDASLLASVSETVDDVAQALATLSEFVEPAGDGRYRFIDAMVREVAYARLPFRTRSALHDRITDVLLGLGRDEILVDQLAFHSYRAQRWDEAYEFAHRAARKAESAYANVDAIHLYEQALDAARRTDLPGDRAASTWETVGNLQKRIGRLDRADVAFRTARRLQHDRLGSARLMYKQADLRQDLGRYPDALRWLTRARNEIDGLDDPNACSIRAEIEAKYGAIRQAQGRSRDAVVWSERALASACPAGAVAAEARATKILDGARRALGVSEDDTLSLRALELYERVGDLDGQAGMLNNLGTWAFWRGEWAEAVRMWEQSTEILDRIGNASKASLGAGNIAEVLADQGHLEEAEKRFRRVRRIWSAAGDRYGEAFADLHLARIAARSGRLDEADALFTAARDEFDTIGATAEVAEAELRRAEGLLFAGRSREAGEALLAAGVSPVPEALPPPLVPIAHRTIGMGHLQSGDLDRAAASFDAAMDSAARQGATYEEALILAAQVRLALLTGDAYEALADRHQRLVDELGIVALPAIPGRR